MRKTKKNISTTTKKSDISLEQSMPYILYRITDSMTQRFRNATGSLKITISEWRVLSSLDSRNGLATIGELAACTVIKQPIVSRIISELEERGLVAKTPGDMDQRVICVHITKEGEKLFESILPYAIQNRKLLIDGLNKKEIEQLKNILKKMQSNLDIVM